MAIKKYFPNEIEQKWQKKWEEEQMYQAEDFSKNPKFYTLIEFPYPSGAGLHVGHIRSWSAMDAYSRKKRMEGKNVLYPIGWDAFGLPAENYAIKMKVHPKEIVAQNIANFKRQIKSLGISFDWSREVDTTDSKYYKWTQWIFLKFFEKGLAYQADVPVNWCPFCKTNLADEEVLADGTHERCGTLTEKRMQKQWLLAITKYADRLLEDLKTVDYPNQIRTQQESWIGRSEGVQIEFKVQSSKFKVEVFTTRPETTDGATFLVVAPEHEIVSSILSSKFSPKRTSFPEAAKVQSSKLEEIKEYVEKAKKKAERERTAEGREKTGVFTGQYVKNPVTNEDIPVWVADYVLAGYGTGAIMAVPFADERDKDFATKFKLPIIETTFKAKPQGKKSVNYHLRDWVFSRQHYWGEPIPVIHCDKCGVVGVPEKDLPVELPYLEKYEPSGTGESPLSKVADWVNVSCPKCAGLAKRETDTMPNWAGSNWYYLAYLIKNSLGVQSSKLKVKSSEQETDIFTQNQDLIKYWMPIDVYQGGYEHTTLHLLYSRFVYKFLFDQGIVPNSEPYAKRRVHGIVLGPDGRKMSKSFGNVVNPDDIIKSYGADGLRIYEMFMGPFDQTIAWNDNGVEGCFRFLKRIWILSQANVSDSPTSSKLQSSLSKTIKKVGEDIEAFKFNTAVSKMMQFINAWQADKDGLSKEDLGKFLSILAPFAPHLAEEIWQSINPTASSIHLQKWPEFDPKHLVSDEVVIVIQVNGRVRDSIEVKSEKLKVKSEIEEEAKKSGKVKPYLEGKKIIKIVYVEGKIINFVIN